MLKRGRYWALAMTGAVILTLSSVPTAYAWHQGHGYWDNSVTTRNYCLNSTVTGHTSWPALIASAVDQYNNYSNGGTSHPQWVSSCAHGNHPIDFVVAPLDPGLCGLTSWAPGSGAMADAKIDYTNRYTYYGGSQTNCNFTWTTLHEFGHSQGLVHSCNSAAVMYYADNAVSYLTTDDQSAYQWEYNRPPFSGTPDAGCNL